MRDLLEQLKEPLEDQEHARLLEQVKQLSANFLQQTGLNGSLALFGLLENHRNDRNRSRIQRQGAAMLSDTLLTDEIKNQLADAVADQSLKISQRRALAGLLVG
ncbi:MAG: hypothetical protein GXP51_02190, partial [Deltaproteobacteria bacterium]|nr:hypothetical protein [Deltaproteobacteria bacterium]